uniref:Uncharacterized protein n=1 Tax=Arundo donax TaxID=35708 RepID=A0A0A9GGB6_ARUDO
MTLLTIICKFLPEESRYYTEGNRIARSMSAIALNTCTCSL